MAGPVLVNYIREYQIDRGVDRLDRAGNNPYCHYRVLELAGRGLRERVSIIGGTLEAGPCADGGFAVRAELPVAR